MPEIREGHLQSREAWESVRDWIDQVNPRFSFEVADRYVLARSITDAQVATAQAARAAIVARMNEVFSGGNTVVCLPTTVAPAPPIGQRVSERHSLRLRNSALRAAENIVSSPRATPWVVLYTRFGLGMISWLQGDVEVAKEQ